MSRPTLRTIYASAAVRRSIVFFRFLSLVANNIRIWLGVPKVAAGVLIERQPVWDYGLGGYLEGGKEVRKVYPNIESHLGTWSNPYNEYLLVMVEKGGVIGLITLLFLFAGPGYLFLQALRKAGDSAAGQQVKFYAMSGLSILVVCAVVGLSVALFQHDVFNHFFALMVLLFALQIRVIGCMGSRAEEESSRDRLG